MPNVGYPVENLGNGLLTLAGATEAIQQALRHAEEADTYETFATAHSRAVALLPREDEESQAHIISEMSLTTPDQTLMVAHTSPGVATDAAGSHDDVSM